MSSLTLWHDESLSAKAENEHALWLSAMYFGYDAERSTTAFLAKNIVIQRQAAAVLAVNDWIVG